MPIVLRLLTALLLACAIVLPAQAEDENTLSPELEKALSTLLDAAPIGKTNPAPADLDTILSFVTTNTKADRRVRPEKRPQGQGAYLHETLNIPLSRLISYTLNPEIPGEALYPNAVRRNMWLPESPLLKNANTFLKATLPPAAPLFTRGVEFEEITPDSSSGCYYDYKLNRLFALTGFKGHAALFSVSSMPAQSSVGLKGAIVGKDSDWAYVYSGEQGTNLPFLGWAETYMYGSASVTVFFENGNKTEMFMFKWARAGWNGSNVIKPSHITEGLKRFTGGLKQVLESPKCPAPEAIASQFKTLSALSEKDLRARLTPFSAWVASQKTSPLKDKEFRKVLDNNAYPGTMSKDNLIAELMKLFMREQLGLSTPPAAQ